MASIPIATTAALTTACLLCWCSAASNALEISVDEELANGTVIGNVKVQHYDLHKIPTAGKKFHLFQKTNPARKTDLFEVDPDSGDIRVKGRIDREALCPANPSQCRTEFSIYQDSLSQKVDVFVLINDINDCQPKWPVPGDVFRVDFLDGDGPGKNKDIPAAVDKDLGKNARIRYTLDNLGAPFSLKQKLDENRLSLETSRMIDREEKESYNMTLVANDEGNPPLSGSILLQVFIIDVNDNAPEFDRSFYTPSKPIYESEPVNSVILQLKATDKDSGAYGAVMYDFAATAGDDQQLAREYFTVRFNGKILIRKPLDYDQMAKKYFQFEVIARDNAHDKEYRRTATATVSISVLDRVDEAPVIETCFLPFGCTASPSVPSIQENLALRSKIAEVMVRDPDVGDQIQCATVTSDRQPPQHLSGGGLGEDKQEGPFILLPSRSTYGSAGSLDSTMKIFDLVTNRVFDRESSSRVCFGIVCTDSKHLEGRANYCVTIEDVNDSPPVVDGPIVLQALEEDAERRPLHGRVRDHVKDADIGKNSRLRFALDPSDQEAARLFEVNADTGQLRPLVVFDRERQASYTLRVLVTDGGQPALSATATVTVRVIDANDREPVCRQSEYRLRVPENRPAGSAVGVVEAQDEDEPEHGNGAIAYRLDDRAGDTDWRAFSVDRRTGEVKTSMPLDRERQAHYSFRVLAEDQPRSGHGALTGTCIVSVTVEDENDNRPVFRVTPEHPEVFQVTKREPGISIGQVLAEDSDEGDNRLVDYELLNRAEVRDLFSVDRRSGLVIINKALHNQPARDFILLVRACDRGRPRNCSTEARYRAHIVDRRDAAYQGGGSGAGAGGSGGSPGGGSDSAGGGKVGLGNEIVIVCLSVMFLVLCIATVTVVCLIVRKRSVYVKKSRQPAVAMTAGADAEHADVKMISGSYDVPPAYKDFNGEEDFCTYNANLQLKPTTSGTYGYRTVGRYCTTSPGAASTSAPDPDRQQHQEYQPLDTAAVRLARQAGDSAKLYQTGLHMYYEIKGTAAATASGQTGSHLPGAGECGDEATLPAHPQPPPPPTQQPPSGLCVDGSKAATLTSAAKQQQPQHYPTFSPYTEASFV